MTEKVFTDYFFDKTAFNVHDAAYVPLVVPEVPETKLLIPSILKPDKETATDAWYTLTAQAGETQMLPGAKTKTWGYGTSVLGQTIVYQVGKHNHVTLQNQLPELTTFHWHGLGVTGPYVDGGCHAPVYPGESKTIDFTLNQPGATTWLHPHPCPSTAEQVWRGLAAMVIVKDDSENGLNLPHDYGVDDIPVILQDRFFEDDNQWDYRKRYDPDGIQGPTPVINGTVNPVFDVTTQKIRLRILDGANRREWRLHFSDDLPFVQVAGDSSLLPHPVTMTHLMITCAERAEIVLDFKDYQAYDTVTLFTDDTPLIQFKIHEFSANHTTIPERLYTIHTPEVDSNTAIRKIVMSGMDEMVMLDGKKFEMERIDATQPIGLEQYWDITNTNDMKDGMVHPFHVHGTEFLVISRNGKAPYPNEHGYKDTVGVNPGETVRIQVRFYLPGLYMYHCHILEHEDGGMMAQIQSFEPGQPLPQYELMNMDKMTAALAKERGIDPKDLWLGGMESYMKMGMKM